MTQPVEECSEIEVKRVRLSVVVPCFNEARTLERSLERLIAIQDESLELEVIIVDDKSTDSSLSIAREFASHHREVTVVCQPENQGKGAALRTGFRIASGEIIAVQDADLEYDPRDLKRMIGLIRKDLADVVFGTRFSLSRAHRVLYYWHYLGNRFLTLLSNMFTDLNLSDMECCYKVFRREIIRAIDIQESRFGIEPELVAKVAQMRCRVYEMGVSYAGRTYGEGKKIGVRDGFRALYCILRYNAFNAPTPIQFLTYLVIGGCAAGVNLFSFLFLRWIGVEDVLAIPSAYLAAATVNYLLCISLLFRHRARWRSSAEIAVYLAVVLVGAGIDFFVTWGLLHSGGAPWAAKAVACGVGLAFNFVGRRYLVFPEPTVGPWTSRKANTTASPPVPLSPTIIPAGTKPMKPISHKPGAIPNDESGWE